MPQAITSLALGSRSEIFSSFSPPCDTIGRERGIVTFSAMRSNPSPVLPSVLSELLFVVGASLGLFAFHVTLRLLRRIGLAQIILAALLAGKRIFGGVR